MANTSSDTSLADQVMMEAQGLMFQFLGLENAAREVTAALDATYYKLVPWLKPDAVLEVGAHEGRFSRVMRRRMPETPVIAFEANAEVYAKHVHALTTAGVDYRHQAVAATEGEVVFSVPKRKGRSQATMGSLLSSDAAEFDEQRVPSIQLDSLEYERAALWIDVEGAIGQVIEGGEYTLSTALSVLVELEDLQRWPGQMTAKEVIAAFSHFGLVPVIRDIQKSWQFNVLFLRREIAIKTSPRMRSEYFATLRGINHKAS